MESSCDVLAAQREAEGGDDENEEEELFDWLTPEDLELRQDGGDVLSQLSEDEELDECANDGDRLDASQEVSSVGSSASFASRIDDVDSPRFQSAKTSPRKTLRVGGKDSLSGKCRTNNFSSKSRAATDNESGVVSASPGAGNYAHLVVFTAHKAGMDESKRSREEVNKKILELSKGSAFFKNAQARDRKLDARIKTLKAKLERIRKSTGQQDTSRVTMARLVARLEQDRRLDRFWVVVDLDMFFAAVAMRDNPSLRGKPVAVGGIGMLSTANYEARKYGVRSAMPGFIAKKLCPDLIIVKSNFPAYKVAAKQTREIFAQYDPHFTAGSLDEASLDITEYLRKRVSSDLKVAEISLRRELEAHTEGADDEAYLSINEDYATAKISDLYMQRMRAAATETVAELRQRVFEATRGLTCSAGIAPNRMLAKIASDMNKPNGQFFVGHSRLAVIDFMRRLPLRKVPGVGRITERILKEVFNCHTCGELFEQRHAIHPAILTLRTRDWLISSVLGIASAVRDDPSGSRRVGPHRKGISCERTFRSISDREQLMSMCDRIAENLAEHMLKESLKGKTVTLKLKKGTFEILTRAKTLRTYIYKVADIRRVARDLLQSELPIAGGVRLLGIRCSQFHGSGAKLLPGQKKLPALLAAAPVASTSKKATSKSPTAKRKSIRWSDVDASVLQELPPDIREEVERSLKPRHNFPPKQKKRKTEASHNIRDFFSRKSK